jgi:hypothetical protein
MKCKTEEIGRSFQQHKGGSICQNSIGYTTTFADNHAATDYGTPRTIKMGSTTFDVANG